MVRAFVALCCVGLAVQSADAGLFGRRNCGGCQPQRVVVYKASPVQPAAHAVSQDQGRVEACPDVRSRTGCPDNNCLPFRRPPSNPPSNPPTTPPPFDFPPDDGGDPPTVPVPPPSNPPVNPLDRAHAIIMILSAVAGILAGFGVVKAEDDPDDDPENDGLLKAAFDRIKKGGLV